MLGSEFVKMHGDLLQRVPYFLSISTYVGKGNPTAKPSNKSL